jgi:CBS domain-containing protein
MSRPVLTAEPGEDLREAARRLRESRVRHLPIVERGALVGMLSERDVRRGLARLVPDSPGLRVADVMSTECMTIAPDRPLHAAAHTLIECRIGALPVVLDEALVGIVTQRDLLECYAE